MVSISPRRCVCLGLFFLPRSRKKMRFVCSSSCIKRKGETERVKTWRNIFSFSLNGFTFFHYFSSYMACHFCSFSGPCAFSLLFLQAFLYGQCITLRGVSMGLVMRNTNMGIDGSVNWEFHLHDFIFVLFLVVGFIFIY